MMQILRILKHSKDEIFPEELDKVEQVMIRLIFQHRRREGLTDGPAKPEQHAKYQLKVQYI